MFVVMMIIVIVSTFHNDMEIACVCVCQCVCYHEFVSSLVFEQPNYWLRFHSQTYY